MARSIRDSDADDVIRRKIPTIRETTDSSIITSASAVFYKQISGTGELELDATNVKFIQITNTHLTLNTYVSLSIKRSVAPAEIFIVKRMLLPIGTAVIFEGAELVVEDSTNLPADDQINYGIQLHVASGTPTVDIIVRS